MNIFEDGKGRKFEVRPMLCNLVVIDIDTAESDAPLWGTLQAMGLPADYPWVVQTPDQSFHIWVRCPTAELEQYLGGQDKLIGDLPGCKQVELRWRGYIGMLPPSAHPNGGRYAYLSGGDIPGEPPTTVAVQEVLAVAAWRSTRLRNRAALALLLWKGNHERNL